MYHPRTEVPQNAGKFVWQIIYRTKEKCLETITGYVTKKLAEWFGRTSCIKMNQIEEIFNEIIRNKIARGKKTCSVAKLFIT